jgi:hypothetical protein
MGRTGLWLGTWHPMLLVLGTLWFSECGQLGGMGSLADMSQTSWEWLACILRIGTSLSIKAYLPLGLTIVGSCHIVFSKGRFDNWQEKVLACFKMFMSCPVLNVFKLVAPKCYLSVLLTDLPSTSLINFLTLFFFFKSWSPLLWPLWNGSDLSFSWVAWRKGNYRGWRSGSWLKALAFLEDLGSVFRTHMMTYSHL